MPDGRTDIPHATYRLQVTPELGFRGVRDRIPYLRRLGVSHLYLSPVFAARPGSRHGYDVVDPRRPSPELGGAAEFQALAAAAAGAGMGLLLDIVPNHMATAAENPWWWDLLLHGPSSPFADAFDVHWTVEGLPPGRILLPVLGEPYAEALKGGGLAVDLEAGAPTVRYHDRRFPVEPGSWPLLFAGEGEGPPHPSLAELSAEVGEMPGWRETGPEAAGRRRAVAASARGALRRIVAEDRAAARWVAARLRAFSPGGGTTRPGARGPASGQGDPGRPHGVAGSGGAAARAGAVERLHRLLEAQPYRLGHWRLAAELQGYRRFFDIAELVGVRVELPWVFESTHALLLRLVREGRVTGVRIDHIDGLRDPTGYLRRLRRRLDGPVAGDPSRGEAAGEGGGTYIVVEKILAPDESLPEEWPVAGSTGYDFLGRVQGVFVDRAGLAALDRTYHRFTGREAEFEDVARRGKKRVMGELFGGEMRSLERTLVTLAREDLDARDLPASALEEALREVTACLSVYRTYTRGGETAARDRERVLRAVREAGRRAPGLPAAALDFLRRLLTLESAPPEREAAWLDLVLRWQQVTGAVTAKGLEDTAFYVYNRLLSLNEVGAEPDTVSSVTEFHRMNGERARRWPDSLNATSTHDTKRSEDVRARLHVLTEIPAEWEEALTRWSEWNGSHRPVVGGRPAPDRNEEILLYQTLVGGWPLDEGEVPEFVERVEGFTVKALREAKVHSAWTAPDEGYEEAVLTFLRRILEPEAGPFAADVRRFVARVAPFGALNSLGQTLLAMTAPGVPDCYRGTEVWDFSLVDPDNRRPVDFPALEGMLEELDRRGDGDPEGLARELAACWEDGRVKLLLTARALRFRREHPRLFREGEYLPLAAAGPLEAHVCAFGRRAGARWSVTVVARLLTRLEGEGGLPGRRDIWADTRIRLPEGAPTEWLDVHTGRRVPADAGGIPVAAALALLPFALLRGP